MAAVALHLALRARAGGGALAATHDAEGLQRLHDDPDQQREDDETAEKAHVRFPSAVATMVRGEGVPAIAGS